MGKEEGIRVYLRLRPPATAQHSRILGNANNGRGASSVVVDTASCEYYVENTFEGAQVHFHAERKADGEVINNTSEDYTYTFRRVFEPAAGQEDVFNVVAKDCVASALAGYNSTIFAYGQTGSGKTYSITGGTESYHDRGIIPRALGMIYDEVGKKSEHAWSVSIAYLQIYNDKGQDLLNHGKDAKTLDELPTVTVHEVDEETTILRNLEQHAAPTLTDALNLLFLGDTNRLYCETPMNRTSSRSHCVFTVFLEARALGSSVVRRSKLNLVDLAGSERVSKSGVEGTVLTEAKHINLSLHYLEHVIIALSEQARGRRDHVPFRNSFMTMVLRDSLGGNCRTSMLATAHLAKAMLPETISTCSFAQRVARIRQNAKVNEEVDPLILVSKLKMEVAQLKDQLAFYQKQHGGQADPDRELTEEEKLVCSGLVDTYLRKTDPPQTRIEGFQGDLARIYYCFHIMREMVLRNGGGGVSVGSAAGATATAAAAAAAPSASVVEALKAEHEAQIEQLQVSLQQRENEVNTMFELVSKAQGGARFNASTQTADTFDEHGNPIHTHPAPAATAAAAAAVKGALARVAALTESGKLSAAESSAAAEYLSKKRAVLAGDGRDSGDPGGAVAGGTSTTTTGKPTRYNLAALSDTELVEDRAAAFDAFKQSYKNYAKVEATKAELKDKYDSCKATATQLNNTVDTIKAIKTQVQRLRAERAVEGVEEADPQETALMAQLGQQRELYNTLAASLREQKEAIDGMHAFLKRSQEQLTRDFEAWFTTRQKQVALAIHGGGGDTNKSSSNNGNDGSGSSKTMVDASPNSTLALRVPTTRPSPTEAAPRGGNADGQRSSSGSVPILSPLPQSSSSPVGGFPSPVLPLSATLHYSSSSGPNHHHGVDGQALERHPSSAPSPSTSSTRLPTTTSREDHRSGPPSSGWFPASGSERAVPFGGNDASTPPPQQPLPLPLPTTVSPSTSFLAHSANRNSYLASPILPGATSAASAGSHSARNHHLQPISDSTSASVSASTAWGDARVSHSNSSTAQTVGGPLPLPSSSSSSALGVAAAATAATDVRNPYAPQHRSTGNQAADEQLAMLYKLRDSMRAQMQQ